MGMSASQARLLSITARMSDNENTAQSISYAKQRLADQTEQINTEYNNSLNATKLSVVTGYKDAEPTYTDISYNLLTDNKMLSGKQYAVTDAKGRMLVTETIAEAYEAGNGDYNTFLAKLGYTESDATTVYDKLQLSKKDETQETAAQAVHEAWDKYYETVGIDYGDEVHDIKGNLAFSYTVTSRDAKGNVLTGYVSRMSGFAESEVDANGDAPEYEAVLDADGNQVKDASGNVKYQKVTKKDTTGKAITGTDGKPEYETKTVTLDDKKYKLSADGTYYIEDGTYTANFTPIPYDGTTKEQRELYDYAVALTNTYLNGTGTLKTAADSTNNSMLTYYKNIFQKMQQDGYFTYTSTASKLTGDNASHYVFSGNIENTVLHDNALFSGALKKGDLYLEYYSSTNGCFVDTSLAEDQTISEVKDETKISQAETKYEQDLTALEHKDKKFDLELKKLDTEHNTLQTEYDAVKQVIQKNVETSFKTFNA